MNSTNPEFDAYLEDIESDIMPRPRKPKKAKPVAPTVVTTQIATTLAEEGDDSQKGFKPSFTGSKHERQWIMTYLGLFYEDQIISDVLRQVKGGKEATVYICRASPSVGGGLLAAKVYRPRMFRQLRNDAVYRKGREVVGEEGKEVRGRREALAMKKKTDFGQSLRHTTWLANEFHTLERLYSVGVSVPKPYASSDNAILMELIGTEHAAAPALSGVRLHPNAARSIFEGLLRDIELMLAHDRVHADLSAYNVLFWKGKATIIDLPQAVDPYVNPEALALLGRDVERICQYFERYGISTNPGQLTREMWQRQILHRDRGM